MKKRIVGIKLGSSTMVVDGKIKQEFINHVCEQVCSLEQEGFGVFIVISGAIASDQTRGRSKNLRSAVGQIRIANEYRSSFEKLGLDCAQLLLTDEQLIDEKSSKTKLTQRIMLEALSAGVIPIINANDAIDDEEIMALEYCADNDKLFKLMCLLVGADIAIIGFDQLGLLDSDGQIINSVMLSEIETVIRHASGGNMLGHGTDGMKTKILVLSELGKGKMQTHLVPAKERNFILRSVAQEKDFGTRFYG